MTEMLHTCTHTASSPAPVPSPSPHASMDDPQFLRLHLLQGHSTGPSGHSEEANHQANHQGVTGRRSGDHLMLCTLQGSHNHHPLLAWQCGGPWADGACV